MWGEKSGLILCPVLPTPFIEKAVFFPVVYSCLLFYRLIDHIVKGKVLVALSCLTLCHPMDCSPPGSSVHGILQTRILEWVAMHSSRGSYWPRNRTHISCKSPALQADSLPLHHLRSPCEVRSVSNLTGVTGKPLESRMTQQGKVLEETWGAEGYTDVISLRPMPGLTSPLVVYQTTSFFAQCPDYIGPGRITILKSTSHVPPKIVLKAIFSLFQSCPTLCDPVDCSTPGFPVYHQLPEPA